MKTTLTQRQCSCIPWWLRPEWDKQRSCRRRSAWLLDRKPAERKIKKLSDEILTIFIPISGLVLTDPKFSDCFRIWEHYPSLDPPYRKCKFSVRLCHSSLLSSPPPPFCADRSRWRRTMICAPLCWRVCHSENNSQANI